jgi:hypothetical protein
LLGDGEAGEEGGHELTRAELVELDAASGVRVRPRTPREDLIGDPRLADSPWTKDREQPRMTEHLT